MKSCHLHNMDGSKIITLNEVSQTEKGNYDTACVWKLKKKKKPKRHKLTYLQNRNRSIHTENKLMIIKGENVRQ